MQHTTLEVTALTDGALQQSITCLYFARGELSDGGRFNGMGGPTVSNARLAMVQMTQSASRSKLTTTATAMACCRYAPSSLCNGAVRRDERSPNQGVVTPPLSSGYPD